MLAIMVHLLGRSSAAVVTVIHVVWYNWVKPEQSVLCEDSTYVTNVKERLHSIIFHNRGLTQPRPFL